MQITDLQYLDRLKLAVALRRNGDYGYARRVAMQLAVDRPAESSVWHTLGQIWTEIGEFDMALECHQESVRLMRTMGAISLDSAQGREQFQMACLGLGQSLMRFGRFEEGLPFFEAGRQGVSWTPWPGSIPYQNPQDLSDAAVVNKESILVQSEGGYGDTFMFMRWLPWLKQKHKFQRVGLMLWGPLETFCDWHALGIDEVYVIDRDKVKFDWQYSTSIMSLPSVFGMKTWGGIPESPRTNRGRWFPGEPNKTNIGFCWRAEENTSPVRTKSLPLDVANDIATNLTYGNSRVFSLSPQKADLYNTGAFEEPSNLIIKPHMMKNWKDTAEYLMVMDIVLTVDTAVAHLAGLLGVPALVLLPVSSCWRWGTGLVGPWYNSWQTPHLTYYRQKVPLQWDAQEIVKTLLERINDDEYERSHPQEA